MGCCYLCVVTDWAFLGSVGIEEVLDLAVPGGDDVGPWVRWAGAEEVLTHFVSWETKRTLSLSHRQICFQNCSQIINTLFRNEGIRKNRRWDRFLSEDQSGARRPEEQSEEWKKNGTV